MGLISAHAKPRNPDDTPASGNISQQFSVNDKEKIDNGRPENVVYDDRTSKKKKLAAVEKN